jgi:hypothetical protein
MNVNDPGDETIRIATAGQLATVLAEASELEHGLMCCYFYAAFGLKTDPSEGLAPDQAEAVRRWKRVLLGIAMEEMSHLALGSNLTVALGVQPHFGRQNFPVMPGYHPANIHLALTPFDRDTLEHFVFLERPEGSDAVDPTRFTAGPQYVRGGGFGRFFPHGEDYSTIGELYRELARGLTTLADSLGEAALFCGSRAAQVGPESASLPGLIAVGNLAEALLAIETIVHQGEGAPGHSEHSHFAQLVAVKAEYDAILSQDPGFVPSRPVASNPVMRRPPIPDGKMYVDDPQAAAVLDSANAAYTLVLLCLVQAYGRSPGSDPADKNTLLDAAIGIMGVVAALGTELTKLPASLSTPAVHAGLSFEAPRALRPLLDAPSQWTILAYSLRRLAEGISSLAGLPSAARLAASLTAIAATLKH